jgi:hypothetical protein
VVPVDKSGRCAWSVRFPRCIHPEAQTVDEMLEGLADINNCAATWRRDGSGSMGERQNSNHLTAGRAIRSCLRRALCDLSRPNDRELDS